jgi:hypothetical protein
MMHITEPWKCENCQNQAAIEAAAAVAKVEDEDQNIEKDEREIVEEDEDHILEEKGDRDRGGEGSASRVQKSSHFKVE